MRCCICLGSGGRAGVCECRSSRIHITCLADVVWSGRDSCSVCLAAWDESAYLTVLEILLNRAEGDEDREAKCQLRLGACLIKAGVFEQGTNAVKESLKLRPCVEGQLELARAHLAQEEPEKAIEHLKTCFGLLMDGHVRTSQRGAYSKLAALWGSCRLAQEQLDQADAALRASLDMSQYADTATVVFALRILAHLLEGHGREKLSMEALRAVCDIAERETTDPAFKALAALELGVKQSRLGMDARERLRSALLVLQRRRHEGSDELIAEARRSLNPRKRLRARTHPEDL